MANILCFNCRKLSDAGNETCAYCDDDRVVAFTDSDCDAWNAAAEICDQTGRYPDARFVADLRKRVEDRAFKREMKACCVDAFGAGYICGDCNGADPMDTTHRADYPFASNH